MGPTPAFCEPGQLGSKGTFGPQGPIGPPGNDIAKVGSLYVIKTLLMSYLCLFSRYYRRKG